MAEVRAVLLDKRPIAEMPDSDYEAEGFAWLHANGVTPPKSAPFPDFSRASFEAWRGSGASLWMLRFDLVSVCGAPAGVGGEGGR